MNPPYSEVAQWTSKAWRAARRGAVVVGLLPNNTDTRWFHSVLEDADEIRFVVGRIQFEPRGKSGNTGGSLIVVWRPGREQRKCGPRFMAWDWRAPMT